MPSEIISLSAAALARRFRNRTLSPLEAVSEIQGWIDQANPEINAFAFRDPDAVIHAARQSEQRWSAGKPLSEFDGVPVTIKDSILVAGWPTRQGSTTISADGPWLEDAPASARLKEAGAVILGKTTLPEFGTKPVTDSALCGITRNPWNTQMTAGGSSGGSAAAVAAGMGPISIGSDSGGSIRQPASYCGVIGFKPSFGRVPSYPAGRSGLLAHIGPIARSMEDIVQTMNIISRPDARDWYSLPYDSRDYRETLWTDYTGPLRVAATPDLGYSWCRADVSEVFAKAVGNFARLPGISMVNADPGITDPSDLFYSIWAAGAQVQVEAVPEHQRQQVNDVIRDAAAFARSQTAMQLHLATEQRYALGHKLSMFFQDYDLLLLPTTPITAFEAGVDQPPDLEKDESNLGWANWDSLVLPFGPANVPAISIPCGFSPSGLPVGLQIVGPRFADRRVLAAAALYLTEFPGEDRVPDLIAKGAVRDGSQV